MSDGSSFYITTPIFYVNDVPHIGHAYTEVAADVLARWHRQAGDDTWLLTGTDEHGQKILRTATANGTTPKEWADRLVHDEWLPLLETIDIANDDFIRTTDERHEKNVQLFLQKLYDDGFIYAGEYEALYCVGCEEFKPQSEIVDGTGEYVGQKVCAIHSKPLELLQEKNYFFRMSDFAQKLLDLYESRPDFVQPEAARNEVVSLRAPGPRPTCRSPGRASTGASRCRGTSPTSSTSGSTRSSTTSPRSGYGAGRRAVRPPLAGDAHRRQGHPPLPRGHLAGDADGRRARRAAPGLRPRLAAGRRREDVEVEAHRHRPDADHRDVRFRRVPLLLHARDQLRPGRLVQLGRPGRPLPVGARERFRQPRVARDRDGLALLRRHRAAGRRLRRRRSGGAGCGGQGGRRRGCRDRQPRHPRRARRDLDGRRRTQRVHHRPRSRGRSRRTRPSASGWAPCSTRLRKASVRSPCCCRRSSRRPPSGSGSRSAPARSWVRSRRSRIRDAGRWGQLAAGTAVNGLEALFPRIEATVV